MAKTKTKKKQSGVKIFFDPVANTMNIWWADPNTAYSAEEVSSEFRDDVIIKDKKGRPVSLEIIGILPEELNISEQLGRLLKSKKTPFILTSG